MASSKELKWPLSKDIPNLTGKVALVTGANSALGMGFHTAYQLASAGAKVYIGSRSISKADAAIKEMRASNVGIQAQNLVPFVADLGDLKAVRQAAEEVVKAESRLDILVNNAALLSMPLKLNSDGISVSFAVNHLGPFVLTNTLLPLLKRTAAISDDVRVVVVSAATYVFPPLGISFDSLACFNAEMEDSRYGDAAFIRYGLSKLANLLFARQLQKRFTAEDINAIAISLHPGLVKTDGSRKLLGPERAHLLEGKMTPNEGANTILFAATNPVLWKEKDKFGGAYLVPPGKIEVPSGNGADDKLAEELWVTSERVVKKILE